MMPSNNDNNPDLEEGLSVSPPSSTVPNDVGSHSTSTLASASGTLFVASSTPPFVSSDSSPFTLASMQTGTTNGKEDGTLDIEEGIITGSHPAAEQNVTGISSPFILASMDNSSSKDATASNPTSVPAPGMTAPSAGMPQLIASQAKQPPVMAADSLASPELINQDNGPPPPFDVPEEFFDADDGNPEKNASKAENIAGDVGPEPPNAVFEDAEYSSKVARINELKSLNTLSPPTPFNYTDVEDKDDEAIMEKEKLKSLESSQKPSANITGSAKFDEADKRKEPAAARDDESIIGPPREEVEDSLVLATNRGNTPGRRGWNNDADRNNRPVVADDVFHDSMDVAEDEENGQDNNGPPSASVMPSSSHGLPEIAEAYLVGDGNEEVIIATPLEPPVPWWKQPRAKLLFGVVFVIVATMAIALGVSFSRNKPLSIPEVIVVASSDAPSLSLSPSLLPSHNPTITPNTAPSAIPTTVPSTSLGPSSSPTVLYCIDIAIVYDDFPEETSWEIHRVVGVGIDNELVKSHRAEWGDTSHDESICLLEGEYVFTIYDSCGDGISEEVFIDDDYVSDYVGNGHYTVTSNGAAIVEGGEFGESETTSFSIPFVPYPSMSPSPSTAPSSSSSPSMSQSPSLAPSTSSSPTETCYWIDIAIVYDNYPEDISWEIHRVVGDSIDNELVKSHRASRGDTSHDESICLQEGEYEFTISNSVGEGICCSWGDGHYNVTSNGALIVEGGEFRTSESTTFSIPFVPSA